jgi:transposase-like protein
MLSTRAPPGTLGQRVRAFGTTIPGWPRLVLAQLPDWPLGKSCPGAVASLEEAGEELLTVYRYPRSQWKGLRTTNAIDRLYLDFRRRIKTQGGLPGEAAVLALLYGLLASGQIRFRKLDGWQDMAVALTTAAKTDKAA